MFLGEAIRSSYASPMRMKSTGAPLAHTSQHARIVSATVVKGGKGLTSDRESRAFFG
jgi:hypothetical protein